MADSRKFRNLVMFFLAWFPILNIYKSPFFMGYGSFILLLLFVICSIKIKSVFSSIQLPKQYLIVWGWCALAYFISCLPEIRIGPFIPGGFDFFIFSLLLGFIIREFEVNSFKNNTKIVVVISGSLLIIQEIF